MEQASGEKQGREYWRDHVLRAREYSGSDVQYCRENDLKAGTFSWNKKRFRETPIKKSDKKFSRVEVVSATERAPTGLPDPKWLSEFLKAWMGS